MITTGFSNTTPWRSPRELEENALDEYLERMYRSVEDPEHLVAVVHVPPRGTHLDQAPEIDDEFRPKMESGSVRLTDVGSSAVRRFIEERQPAVGLHGHVHESKAAQRLGRTLCVNPGSTYSEGILAGALITLPEDGPPGFQFVAG
jgi:Icc-related predicted phosphoesterase